MQHVAMLVMISSITFDRSKTETSRSGLVNLKSYSNHYHKENSEEL